MKLSGVSGQARACVDKIHLNYDGRRRLNFI
jgi:hypothetical protein